MTEKWLTCILPMTIYLTMNIGVDTYTSMMVIAHTSVGTAKYQFLAWTRVPNAGISLVSPQYEGGTI